MGMDIWGMYNGCRAVNMEFVYPIVEVDYENATKIRPRDRVSNVKIIRDGTLRSNGFDFDKSVYVRERDSHKLEIGDHEWVKWNNRTYVRVEVIDILNFTRDVAVFESVGERLNRAVDSAYDKALINLIGLFNDVYYANRNPVLGSSVYDDLNEMSLSWWEGVNQDKLLNNIFVELDQSDIDYLLESVDEFTQREGIGGYSLEFFDALREDVIHNRVSYVIDAS